MESNAARRDRWQASARQKFNALINLRLKAIICAVSARLGIGGHSPAIAQVIASQHAEDFTRNPSFAGGRPKVR
jgi:hypothetical protein